MSAAFHIAQCICVCLTHSTNSVITENTWLPITDFRFFPSDLFGYHISCLTSGSGRTIHLFSPSLEFFFSPRKWQIYTDPSERKSLRFQQPQGKVRLWSSHRLNNQHIKSCIKSLRATSGTAGYLSSFPFPEVSFNSAGPRRWPVRILSAANIFQCNFPEHRKFLGYFPSFMFNYSPEPLIFLSERTSVPYLL